MGISELLDDIRRTFVLCVHGLIPFRCRHSWLNINPVTYSRKIVDLYSKIANFVFRKNMKTRVNEFTKSIKKSNMLCVVVKME